MQIFDQVFSGKFQVFFSDSQSSMLSLNFMFCSTATLKFFNKVRSPYCSSLSSLIVSQSFLTLGKKSGSHRQAHLYEELKSLYSSSYSCFSLASAPRNSILAIPMR